MMPYTLSMNSRWVQALCCQAMASLQEAKRIYEAKVSETESETEARMARFQTSHREREQANKQTEVHKMILELSASC